MSLLTIARAVAQDCGFASPASIVGNADDTAVMLLALINKSGKALARRPWATLQKEHTITTVIGTPDYALPVDYGYYENDTAWDRTGFLPIAGSLSPQEWQIFKSSQIGSGIPFTSFRVKAGRVYLDPTPVDVRTLIIEYVSKRWVSNAAGTTFYDSFQIDTDLSLIDEYLLELDLTWRFLERKGLAYDEAKLEADETIDLMLGQDVPRNPIDLNDRGGAWPPLPRAPLTGFG